MAIRHHRPHAVAWAILIHSLYMLGVIGFVAAAALPGSNLGAPQSLSITPQDVTMPEIYKLLLPSSIIDAGTQLILYLDSSTTEKRAMHMLAQKQEAYDPNLPKKLILEALRVKLGKTAPRSKHIIANAGASDMIASNKDKSDLCHTCSVLLRRDSDDSLNDGKKIDLWMIYTSLAASALLIWIFWGIILWIGMPRPRDKLLYFQKLFGCWYCIVRIMYFQKLKREIRRSQYIRAREALATSSPPSPPSPPPDYEFALTVESHRPPPIQSGECASTVPEHRSTTPQPADPSPGDVSSSWLRDTEQILDEISGVVLTDASNLSAAFSPPPAYEELEPQLSEMANNSAQMRGATYAQ